MISDQIKACLNQEFQPFFINVVDDSARHHGHLGAQPGGSTHFRVTVVSKVFKNLSLVKRHQAVYHALQSFFKEGVHALQLELWTVEEWHGQAKNQTPL